MLTERIEPRPELLDKLDQIPLGRMYQAAFRALMRLQVWFTGRTHERMLEFGERAQAAILKAADKEGQLDSVLALRAEIQIRELWEKTWEQWTQDFQTARREAAKIAFGVSAVFHDRVLISAIKEMEGMEEAKKLTESIADGVYDPQLQILLEIAENYLYGDGLNLSGRIWRIDQETREGINRILLNGIQSGDSAWNIAKQLEPFLGAGADCPRWSKQRLYGMTASEKTTSAKGLMTGENCAGQGVSYNALRLARTEVQKMHGLATDRMMAQQPWIKEEQIHLSASHPETDICDDVVQAGRDGQGIYPVGEIELPLHPNCLCYKTSVEIPEAEFTSKLRGWMKGEQDWAELDAYAENLGVDVNTSLRPAGINLAVWLFSEKLEEWMKS